MKRTWTIIGVADVGRSFAWYQALFGLAAAGPAHSYFGQVVDEDGTVLLCLHQWGAHDHASLADPGRAPPGNGLLLFFRVDDFDETLARARGLVPGWRRSPASIRTRAPWSSRCAIPTGTASWSARLAAPSATGTAPAAGEVRMGAREATAWRPCRRIPSLGRRGRGAPC